jgi:hypothetical protein
MMALPLGRKSGMVMVTFFPESFLQSAMFAILKYLWFERGKSVS